MSSSNTSEVAVRLDRIKKLCDELEEAQHDARKYRTLIDRIRREAESFQHTLATHDPQSTSE